MFFRLGNRLKTLRHPSMANFAKESLARTNRFVALAAIKTDSLLPGVEDDPPDSLRLGVLFQSLEDLPA